MATAAAPLVDDVVAFPVSVSPVIRNRLSYHRCNVNAPPNVAFSSSPGGKYEGDTVVDNSVAGWVASIQLLDSACNRAAGLSTLVKVNVLTIGVELIPFVDV
jgi:hypothetical protein